MALMTHGRGPVDPWPLFGWMRVVMWGAIGVLTWMLALTGSISIAKRDMLTWQPEQIQTLTLLIAYSQALNVALFVASLIVSARITYRTMSNVHRLKGSNGQAEAAWSVAWYVVPVANLFMPPRAVQKIWRGTFGDGDEAERRSALWWWWGCALISIALHQLQLRASPAIGLIPPEIGDIANPASYAFAVAGTLIFLRVFRRIARGQSLLIKRAAADVF
ncbi:DUF4328 domain-containing protein [Terricaulis silvestris]|uniref:DUF4328 domain-containing protein n=1 Tax=Terricaulis silvestris TaxID=2686094 RepID=A0A6I6MKY2_9CAUL|nr:DUF4328 domain-containing protein [Terricaulis silvestris]QGZ93898.1 hypothetical protein DSM104635_00712 [Terricaulis silvestris]